MKILIIDDERDLIQALEDTLRKAGAKNIMCTLVQTGHEGYRMAIREEYDFILVDGNLGDKSAYHGPAVCRLIKKNEKIKVRRQVIAFSTFEGMNEDMVASGANEQINKRDFLKKYKKGDLTAINTELKRVGIL